MPPLLFSVIVPTRGRPRQLARCLRALRSQHLPREAFEVIVVWDGEQSGKLDIAAPFTQGLQLRFIEQPQAGPAAARNCGVGHAAGRFLAFTDDDCEPAAGWLATLEAALRAAPGGAAGGRVINALAANHCSAASQLLIDYLSAHHNVEGEARFLTTNNFAAPKDAFEDAGGFDETFRMPAAEDREFCFRWLHAKRPLVYAPEAVVHHSHDMNIGGFLRTHFRYGRGAWRLRRILRKSGSGAIRVEPLRFYLKLLSYPWKVRMAQTGRIRISLLLALSQAANAAGFLWEGARAK